MGPLPPPRVSSGSSELVPLWLTALRRRRGGGAQWLRHWFLPCPVLRFHARDAAAATMQATGRVEDLLTLILQSEAAASFDQLLAQGLLDSASPWYSLVTSGQQTPAPAYVGVGGVDGPGPAT